MGDSVIISKSQYLRGRQCEKSLWLLKRRPELRTAPDEALQAVFQQGHEVGRLARKLFPGGSEIVFDRSNFSAMLEKTRRLVSQGEKVIYEAAFRSGAVFAMVDILVRQGSTWDIYEVKAATEIRDYHLDDISVQWYALSGQLDPGRAFIVHINNQYVRKGALDVEDLFQIEDVTEIVKGRQKEVAAEIERFKNILQSEKIPQKEIGRHCCDPVRCDFFEYCWGHIPRQSVFHLYRMTWPRKQALYKDGIITYEDLLRRGIELTDTQYLQVETAIKNRIHIDQGIIKAFLDKISFPLSFLDFETFQEAIPRFNLQRPYMKMPFQYSLHVLNKDGSLDHREFLADEERDPRRPLADRLLQDLAPEGSIMAFCTSFEKTVIKELAAFYRERSKELVSLLDRFVDLMDPFRQLGYYHPQFNGNFSIKSILPAMFPGDPELDYKALEIQDGTMAMSAFPALHKIEDPIEREGIRRSLLAYCRLDTLAMVRIYQRLMEISKAEAA